MMKASLSRSVSSDSGDITLVGELIPGTILLSKSIPSRLFCHKWPVEGVCSHDRVVIALLVGRDARSR